MMWPETQPIRFIGGLLLALMGLAMLGCAAPAAAGTLHINRSLCHAVSGSEASDASLAERRFSCTDAPVGYQHGSLWLRADLSRSPDARRDAALMIHHSRFDRLAVAFSYADGQVYWQQVRQGDYGSRWRAGGQILFEAPDRPAQIGRAHV